MRDADVLVVTSKVVSKSQGCTSTEPVADVVTSESVRTVARRGPLTITQTRHGVVLANAGVDASNVAAGTVLLLPEDPDRAAADLRDSISRLIGVNVAVIISDTGGRAWRRGLVDFALGCAGIRALRDYRGQPDGYGQVLAATEMADADALAAAAELAKGKLSGVPAVLVRGFEFLPGDEGAHVLVRPDEEDLFPLGSAEASVAAVEGNPVRYPEQLSDEIVAAVIDSAARAPRDPSLPTAQVRRDEPGLLSVSAQGPRSEASVAAAAVGLTLSARAHGLDAHWSMTPDGAAVALSSQTRA